MAVSSAPLWPELSLMTECRRWMETALEHLDPSNAEAPRQEMALQTARAHALIYAACTRAEAYEALNRACTLAETAHDTDYLLRGLASRALEHTRFEDFQGALAVARQAEEIVGPSGGISAASAVNCLTGYCLFLLARYREALTYCQKAHHDMTQDERRSQIVRFGCDFSIFARGIEAQIYWFRGLIEHSAEASRDALTQAEARGHPQTLGIALGWCGCRMSLKFGDLEAAERSIARLKDITERHSLTNYRFACIGYSGQLCADRGDSTAGVELVRAALKGFREAEHENFYTAFLLRLAAVLASANRYREGLDAIDETLHRIERSGKHWLATEALRVKGDLLMTSPGADRAEAASYLRRSLELARHQGAQSSELLAAMSYGRWLHSQDRAQEAYELLSSVYTRFTEGFRFPDLQAAKQLLDAWAPNRARSSSYEAGLYHSPGSRLG